MPISRAVSDPGEDLKGLRELDTLREACRTKLGNARTKLHDVWTRDHDSDAATAAGKRRFPFADEALALKAFYGKPLGQAPETLRRRILAITCDEIDDTTRRVDDPFDVVDAARLMQALVAAPRAPLSAPMLWLYYLIVRELYTVAGPGDRTVGAARASTEPSGFITAYATSECVRALLGYSRNLTDTARLLREIGALRRSGQAVTNAALPSAWKEASEERLALDLLVGLNSHSQAIALPVALPTNVQEARRFVLTIADDTRQALVNLKDAFSNAVSRAERRRNPPPAPTDGPRERRQHAWEEAAHTVAVEALREAAVRLNDAVASFIEGNDENWEVLGSCFEQASQRVRRVLDPSLAYLEGVLDRQLNAAARASADLQPHEMASAACAIGAARDSWDDPRLEDAARHLALRLGDDAAFHPETACHRREGWTWTVYNAHALRLLAQLLQHKGHALDRAVEERALRIILIGPKDSAPEPRSQLGHIARTALTLTRLHRMLDVRLNGEVTRHFKFTAIEKSKGPLLRDLLPGDVGVSRMSPESRVAGVRRPEPLARAFQRLRAHVVGVSLDEPLLKPLNSLVLYGPPGTGKTQIVKSLAFSSRCELLELSPSDLLVAGADELEKRTREVFELLSFLSDAVILLDEFDPVLASRKSADTRQGGVLSFLTPGMLPKLADLHDRAERQRVAYVLNTNHIEQLDDAALRRGRFDAHVAVFGPDLLSRAARWHTDVPVYAAATGLDLPEDFEHRLRRVLQRTRGTGMVDIWHKGFLRPPAGARPDVTTPYAYLLGLAKEDEVEWPRVSTAPATLPAEGGNQWSQDEQRLAKWLRDWEDCLTHQEHRRLWDVIAEPPRSE